MNQSIWIEILTPPQKKIKLLQIKKLTSTKKKKKKMLEGVASCILIMSGEQMKKLLILTKTYNKLFTYIYTQENI